MQHHTIVLPEYLNDQGFLFGGNLLKWVDEYAYITACLEFPGNRFVTISLDNVNFQHPVLPGEILRFDVVRLRRGNSSLQYSVKVFGEKLAGHDKPLFETNMSFVNVDVEGKPQSISDK
ncbi:MAG: acyl-CoA hydrolase [Oceanicoccus sp.]|jgi:acyl-CoA hydrolase